MPDLAKSDRLFRTLFEHFPDPCLLIKDNRFIYCNQAAVDILHARNKDEVLNIHPSDLSPERQPDGRLSSEKADDMIALAIRNGSHRFEWMHRGLDGRDFISDIGLTLFAHEGQSVLCTVWHDISEIKEAEKSIRKSRDLLNNIIDFLPDPTFIIDGSGTVMFWNRAVERMTNVRAADIIGKSNYAHALPFYGERRPILVDLVFNEDDGFQKQYPYIKRREGMLTGEAYVPTLDIYLYGNASVLRDSSGEVIGAIESVRDITEEKNTQKNLREALSAAETAWGEAEKANRAKARFLAAASHDLRQPTHAQGLFLDVLSRTTLDEKQQELLANVRALVGASADMLHALLDFSRIEAGVIDPQPRAFSMQTILNKIEREFGPQADAKGLIYRSHETELFAYSDPTLVELIARNLVSNAIRYTEKGGVLVTCRRRAGAVEFNVWDTGIGIAPEHQEEIFHEFLQLGNPERDRRKGLGLGLAITKGLARRLDHTLTLRSRPDRGSVFRLTMPQADAALTVVSEQSDETVRLAGQFYVLVIDDDEAVCIGMRHLLEQWGYRCDAVGSIDEALVAAERRAPDVVISDYRLRGHQTGADAIAALRALVGERLPALLVTGDTATERLAEAHAYGIPLLHKPVPPDELRHSLADVLTPTSG